MKEGVTKVGWGFDQCIVILLRWMGDDGWVMMDEMCETGLDRRRLLSGYDGKIHLLHCQ